MEVDGRRREFSLAMASSCLLFAAFPPLGWSWLAWLAPIGWLRLIRQPAWTSRRPYRMLFLVGMLHWLALVQWIRLPHWSAHFGWPVLSAYLGAYLPLFVAVTRRLVHYWKWPIGIAAPIVWAALELFRGYFLTGFSLSLLAHTQARSFLVLQTAEWWGAYGVSFLIIGFACACEDAFDRWLQRRHQKAVPSARVWPPLAIALVLIGLILSYGIVRVDRIETDLTANGERSLKVALVQGALDTQFDEGSGERIREAYFDYARHSRDVATRHPDLDLILWPESMFTATEAMVSYEEPVEIVDGWNGTVAELRQRLDDYVVAVEGRMRWLASQTQTPMLVGTAWDHYVGGDAERFNSAILIDADGVCTGRYDKMHPVMFGEYIPLGELCPWLYRLTPMRNGLTPGAGPFSFVISKVRISPSICFENTVPQLIRRQVRQLQAADQNPDLLVTLSNDGWFWGSSLLDHHLACGIFRAIEMRRPMLVAANTGLSAVIDATGKLRSEGPRRDWQTLVEEVWIADRPIQSIYLGVGDAPAALCLIVVLGVVVEFLSARLKMKQGSKAAEAD